MKSIRLKKLLVLILAVVMVIVPMPVSFAEVGSDIVTLEDTGYKMSFNKTTGYLTYGSVQGWNEVLDIPETVTIPGTEETFTVKGIAAKSMYNRHQIVTVKIPKTVEVIEETAFGYNGHTEEFIVDPANEKFCSVDGVLFSKDMTRLIAYPVCKADTEYVIPDTVTEIDTMAFSWNKNLTKVTIPGTVENIKESTFEGKDYYSHQPENATPIAEVVLSEGIKTIGDGAFARLPHCVNVIIPDSVTSIGEGAFGYAGSESIHFGKGVTVLNNEILSNVKTKSFTVSSDNTAYSAKEGFLLSKNGKDLIIAPKALETIAIPEGVETLKADSVHYTDAKTIKLPASVKSIENEAMGENISLMAYEVATGNTVYSSASGMLLSADGRTLISVPKGLSGEIVVPSTVEVIAEGAFLNNRENTVIVVPDSVKTIKQGAISSYMKTDVQIGSGVTTIEAGGIRISDTNATVSIAEGNTAYKTDTNNSMILSKDGSVVHYVTNRAGEFYSEGESGGDPGKGEPGKGGPVESAFVLPGGITTVGSGAFGDFYASEVIKLNNDVTTIKEDAFAGAYGIAKVITSDNIEVIEDNALQNCKYLQFLEIGKGLKSIGKGAVGGSGHNVVITFNGSEKTWKKIPGSSIENISYTTTPHSPGEAPFGVTVNYLGFNVEVNGGTGSGDYRPGESVTVNAVKPAESEFIKWTATGIEFAHPETAKQTFTMPANDVVLTASFTEPPVQMYNVTIEGGNLVTPAGIGDASGEFEEGTSVVVKAAVPEGSEFVRWETTGITLPDNAGSEITFTMPACDVTLKAVIKKCDYTVTVENGTGSGTYHMGDSVTIKADVPSEGMEFVNWEVTGKDFTGMAGDEITFTMPAGNVTAKAVYQYVNYAVTVENGTGTGAYHMGERVTVKAAVPEGKKFVSWEATGITVPDNAGAEFTFEMPAGNVKLVPVFDLMDYKVTVENGTGGGSYHKGDEVTIKADAPSEGMEFAKWEVTGTDFTGMAGSEIIFTMPAGNVNVKAVYKYTDYTVTVENGAGSGIYHKGDRVTVKAEAPAGEKFVSWTATGINVPDNAGAEFTFEMPAGNVKLTANSKHFHDFNGIWQMDEEEHWKECSCGEKGELGSHSFGKWADAPEAGNLEARTCSLCGYRETREKKPVVIPEKPDEKGNVIISAPDGETVQFSGSDFINITENEEVKEMTVLMGQQSVTYDSAALKAVSENAEAGDIIEIRLSETDNSDEALNTTQKDKIKGMGNGTLYSIELVIKDASGKEKSVHDFNGGTAVVTVPYVNTAGGMVLVYRVETDGTLTPMPTTYDSEEGEVSWTTGGHSHYIITSAKAPVITKGTDAEWRSGTRTGLTFTSDAEFADFLSVKVDNRVVDSEDYDVKEGSTVVTLKSSYLETLTAGKHTLTISSRSGDAETSFTLIAKVSDTRKTGAAGSTIPETGDTRSAGIWLALLAIAFSALFAAKKNNR